MIRMRDGCPFCDYAGPSPLIEEHSDVFVIEPINPVVPGHVLVIPREHVEMGVSAVAVGRACAAAELFAFARIDLHGDERYRSYNLIVSAGAAATQTVPHVHVHVVPRREGDGLALPWDGMGAEKLRERLRDPRLSR